MANSSCPQCGDELPSESINIAEGVAHCRGCGTLSRLSEVVERQRPVAAIIERPPAGCSVSQAGQEIQIWVSLKSATTFLGALFFALFWNGIVSVFVVIAIAGLYSNLIGPLPAWFPAPQMNNKEMSLGMSLFLCLFLTPFVTVGAVSIGTLILAATGRILIRIDTDAASIGTGLTALSWWRRFDPAAVRRVTIGYSTWQTNGEHSPLIVIEADRTIKFGSFLPAERREWLQVVLHELLTDRNSPRSRQILSETMASELN